MNKYNIASHYVKNYNKTSNLIQAIELTRVSFFKPFNSCSQFKNHTLSAVKDPILYAGLAIAAIAGVVFYSGKLIADLSYLDGKHALKSLVNVGVSLGFGIAFATLTVLSPFIIALSTVTRLFSTALSTFKGIQDKNAEENMVRHLMYH